MPSNPAEEIALAMLAELETDTVSGVDEWTGDLADCFMSAAPQRARAKLTARSGDVEVGGCAKRKFCAVPGPRSLISQSARQHQRAGVHSASHSLAATAGALWRSGKCAHPAHINVDGMVEMPSCARVC